MATELQRELYRVLRDAQEKYTYFLLTAAGAAIGLAVSQTQGTRMSWSQLPLALAVLTWGLSFFLGCRHIVYVNSAIYANSDLLRVQAGEHPEIGDHPQAMAAAAAGIRIAIENNSKRANRLGHLQFRSLVFGGVSYLAWHVVEMYLRSP